MRVSPVSNLWWASGLCLGRLGNDILNRDGKVSDALTSLLERDPKTPALARLLIERANPPIRRGLVVGCASGVEAALLGHELRCDVTGIDIRPGFDPIAATMAHLEVGDATSMRFEDGSFDFVY